MEETVELTRPRHMPARKQRSWLHIAAIACGSTILGFGGAMLVVRGALMQPAPAPASPPVVAAAPAHVDPEPEIEAAPDTPTPRASAPMIDARCVVGGDSLPDLCQWDSGLPAISEDGATIVHAVGGVLGDPSKGTTIELVDTKTQKVTKTFVLLSADEALADSDPASARIPLLATVATRLAKLDDILDTGKWTPLGYLGASGAAGTQVSLAESSTYSATIDGDAARITETNERRPDDGTVIFQHRIVAPTPAGPSKLCANVTLSGMRLWHAADQALLFAEEVFSTGEDDSCPTVEVARIATLK